MLWADVRQHCSGKRPFLDDRRGTGLSALLAGTSSEISLALEDDSKTIGTDPLCTLSIFVVTFAPCSVCNAT